jgi:uncharacterized DUF497 family protein
MGMRIPPDKLEKLVRKHGVSRQEVHECFLNREGPIVVDDNEEHVQDPQTLFFIASTDAGRLLMVCFYRDGQDEVIRTVYEPGPAAIRTYRRKCEEAKKP